MLVLIGWAIAMGAVFGGFILSGGHVGALLHPLKLLMIAGAAFGAFIAGCSFGALKDTLKAVPLAFKGARYGKAAYVDLLCLLYEILAKIRKDGLMSIEDDVDAPEESPLFTKYPKVMADHLLMEFITDYLRLMAGGSMNSFELENLMDSEIDTHHKEAQVPVTLIAKAADSMPAFGIVAAVMGVVITMGSMHLPPAELGPMVGAALVGAFVGILFGYALIGPLATALDHKVAESSKALECVKATLLASLNGYPPPVAIEFGRKVLFASERPSFSALEEEVKNRKSA